MRLTQMQLKRELDQARQQGRWSDVEELQLLLEQIGGPVVSPDEPLHTHTVQEGEDPFEVAETRLGSIEYVPDLLQANPQVSVWHPGAVLNLPNLDEPEEPKPQEEQTSAAQLVDLFETLGPPGENWTAEDLALLEQVKAEGIDPGGNGGNGGNGGDGDDGVTYTNGEDSGADQDEIGDESVELPPDLQEIRLPEAQAEAMAGASQTSAIASRPTGG